MIDTIVFSGGGADGALFVGAIKALIEHDKEFDLDAIKTAVGYSVGSIMAVMVGMRMTPEEIEQSMFTGFVTGALSKLDINNLLNLPIRLGIDDGHKIMEWLGNIMSNHGIDRHITLKRFHQLTGNTLVIAATNLTHMRTEFLDAQTAPDLPVLKAVRMSTSVPILFTPVSWQGSLYIDGDAIPTKYLDCVDLGSDRSALELNIVDRPEECQSNTEDPTPNFQTYMLMLYRVLVTRRASSPAAAKSRRIIDIPSISMSQSSPIRYNFMSLQLETHAEARSAMDQFVREGYNATHSQIFSSDQ